MSALQRDSSTKKIWQLVSFSGVVPQPWKIGLLLRALKQLHGQSHCKSGPSSAFCMSCMESGWGGQALIRGLLSSLPVLGTGFELTSARSHTLHPQMQPTAHCWTILPRLQLEAIPWALPDAWSLVKLISIPEAKLHHKRKKKNSYYLILLV